MCHRWAVVWLHRKVAGLLCMIALAGCVIIGLIFGLDPDRLQVRPARGAPGETPRALTVALRLRTSQDTECYALQDIIPVIILCVVRAGNQCEGAAHPCVTS